MTRKCNRRNQIGYKYNPLGYFVRRGVRIGENFASNESAGLKRARRAPRLRRLDEITDPPPKLITPALMADVTGWLFGALAAALCVGGVIALTRLAGLLLGAAS